LSPHAASNATQRITPECRLVEFPVIGASLDREVIKIPTRTFASAAR
jgi:hypothetical protein